VKLRQNYDDGTRREYKTPVFNGEGTIECFSNERFLHWHAAKLEWTTGPEMFDNFEEILTDTALEKWETRIQNNISLGDRTMDRFTQVIEEYILEYRSSSKGLHDQYLRLLSSSCTHQTARSCNENGNVSSAMPNRLPGTEPDTRNKQRI
jgi:hypothetical protein